MHRTKGLSLAAAAAALMVCGAAQAAKLAGQEPDQGPTVGIGVICNTGEQAEQYVSLRAKGQDLTPAVATVNEQARQPRACGIAAIAYIRDQTMGTKTVNGKLVEIVRINVIAGYNGRGWQQVANTVQYAVIETKGMAI
jgi:hypothetical protein